MNPLGTIEMMGLGTIVFILLWLVKFVGGVLYSYVIGPSLHKVDFKSQGKWALVTGCTDGIGKEYARQLAERGCDIVLVSRSMDKLKATSQEIEKEFGVSTKIVQADFTAGDEIYQHIAKEITGLEIGTLVNNVGISYLYPEYFLDLPDAEQTLTNLVRANVVAVTRMSHMIMPAMVARGKGVVVNIGSASSIIPSPLLTVYAATKAYVDKFTEGLEMEYRNKGLIIQSILPGFVCSNMSGIRKSTTFAPSARNFVKSAIALVGTMTCTTGYVPHAMFVNILNCIHEVSDTFALWLVTRSMENSRRKFLKKYKSH